MGVPALFRFLQRKYPKIIVQVEEEKPSTILDSDVAPSVDITTPNPNGIEFDNLYLDMNGIVHPCTHPEGKPAPETEQDMMLEIFHYTERVVNMVRPRKLLFMAIDGVAPRAKMNQQRSRRFRASKDAELQAQELQEAIAAFEGLGHSVSDDIKNKKSWDSNAITPGTPFMTLLAASLRYWTVQKMNTDPGWRDLEVIISDASVPGEGEHKIMDWIRRSRVAPGHDANTQHVIYGLDADLIMLALATHEPHFRVLREDVFADSKRNTGCHSCGSTGHQAAQCNAVLKFNLDGSRPPKKTVTSDEQGFIFLDVTILREYLEIALNIPNLPFPFDLEMAIDDWIFLIFFVGNDFLPHLPSLDIRKGGINTLIDIWKKELPRMGGYVTNHGHLNLDRVQVILEGFAQQEDEILRKSHEDDERQKQREASRSRNPGSGAPIASSAPIVPRAPSIGLGNLPASLPPRPNFDMFSRTSVPPPSVSSPVSTTGSNGGPPPPMVGGTNHSVVANRGALRMANMSAAEALKAELHGLKPLGRNVDPTPNVPITTLAGPPPASEMVVEPVPDMVEKPAEETTVEPAIDEKAPDEAIEVDTAASTVDAADSPATAEPTEEVSHGVKRKAEELDDSDMTNGDPLAEDSSDEAEEVPIVKKSKTEEHDDIKLWTPGYQDRYYRSKFEIPHTDLEFRKRVTTCYIEGLSWVLHYYYQGTPSWTWFYPFHYAPFAGDFEEVDKMVIQFRIGQPFKPFEQLMSVFPAASRTHIPAVYHPLMIDDNSPIIDFYPLEFEIDMNGSSRSWQGIALLPFIDEKRLLEAMTAGNTQLTKSEQLRNTWGSSSLIISGHHPMYNFLCELYTKRHRMEAVDIDMTVSRGLPGKVIKDPTLLPGSTYTSPLTEVGMPDIPDDSSLSVLYFFPKQTTPHRSIMLPGAKSPPRRLDQSDVAFTKAGREYNPNHRGGRGGRDNNFSTTAALGRGSYNTRQGSNYGSYGAGGYQESSYREGPRYAASEYAPQGQSQPYAAAPPPRGYGDYRGSASYEGSRGAPSYRGSYQGRGGYDGYGANANANGNGRGGQPSYADYGYGNSYQGQSRGRGGRGRGDGGGRGGYY